MSKRNKRAYFLSIDALIALIVMLSIVLFIKPFSPQPTMETNVETDLIKVLSSLKIGEINNSYAKQLIDQGEITNLNQSVIEQIGEFYAESSPLAESLAQSILDDLDIDKNVGIYFDNQEVASKSKTSQQNASHIWTSRRIISGIKKGSTVLGYSARAYLSAKNKVKYYYLGGYVGDGNVSFDIDGNIKSVKIEAAFSGDFDLYINDVFKSHYSPQPDVPFVINLSEGEFAPTNNQLKFVKPNSSTTFYIGGGYIKVVYKNSTEILSKHQLPGIEGLINLYDGFYIPGNLTSMSIKLHYKSPYNIYMRIEDKKVFSGNSSNESTINLGDSELSQVLDYGSLSKKTVPLRIGIENITEIMNITKPAKVFSVTDLSGSMNPSCNGAGFFCCLFHGFCTDQTGCEACSGTWEDKIGNAKEANKGFIDSVLNYSVNRVGLVGYNGGIPENYFHQLSNDSASLKAKVDEWTAGGSTCICCGVNRAVNELLNHTTNESFRSIVVMSDGIANVECSQQGTGDPKQDAINAACDAYNNYGIKVYTVGFGEDADEQTLQDMASCGHGNYYYGSVEELVDIYKQIANDILHAIYQKQTIIGEGETTYLYPDSQISFEYEQETPYGILITKETSALGNNITEGTIEIPQNTTPFEVDFLSYSGPYWTDNAWVYNSDDSLWENVYNLSQYSLNYTEIGDPFVVNIPRGKIKVGNNTLRISTGLSPENSTGGSEYDKIVYTVLKKAETYSEIVASAQGCIWNITFEDDSVSTMTIPEDYNGTSLCVYSPDEKTYNTNDAVDIAVFKLLSELDLDNNGKVDIKFNENELSLQSTKITGIPFTWETEVQIRIWQ